MLDDLATESRQRQPAVFIGHGIPEMLMQQGDPTNAWLRRFGETLRAGAPRAVLCISAHFVARPVCVTTADAPPRLHDHDCESLSSIDYPALGSRAVARQVIEHLLHAKIDATADDARGLDHGAWLPLSLMFPSHDVPVVELSLHASADPELHLALGRAVEPLRDAGVLILGSGSLTYESAGVLGSTAARHRPLSDPSRRFQAWVTDLVTGAAPYGRGRGLARFRDHPDIHAVHPTDVHFLPLLVVAGAASIDRTPENVGELCHAGQQDGLSMSAFLFRR